MKNIHILPTDKPSRLSILNSGKLDFGPEIMSSSNSKPQHIYITSNEEIKVGDWYYYFGLIIYYEFGDALTPNCKKIILTTDQDLIKYGVQAIDYEFLEWFVNNQSCESVEVNSIETNPDYKSNWEHRFTYEIIIPKEELTYTESSKKEERIFNANMVIQETLEEAAKNYANYNEQIHNAIKEAVKFGAKWQQERMYSEEEVYHILCEHTAFLFAGGKSTLTDWFEKFKKK